MRTSMLEGVALDWAVAECKARSKLFYVFLGVKSYSTSWELAGPIIEGERLSIFSTVWGSPSGEEWQCQDRDNNVFWGASPLIAAMRCYVASKLGDEVDIPKEIK